MRESALKRSPRGKPSSSRGVRSDRPLRLVSFMAPNMLPVYQYIARRVGALLDLPTVCLVGSDYDEIDGADIAFLCSLAYVQMARRPVPPVEPLAAPVLRGERYAGRPVSYSDVIVRRDSPYRCFADLRGRSWAYNEPLSQSGYGITRHHLLERGETCGYFGPVIEAGWHEVALRWVCDGRVDASAIDAQVLAVAFRDHPELANQLRIIDTLGPSPIQPVVAARRLPPALKARLRQAMLELADTDEGREALAAGLIERLVPMNDRSYEPIRTMLQAAEDAGFMKIA
jgi:phosphonate transport system substrate-binding protein